MRNEQGEQCVTDPRSVRVLWPDGPRWVSASRVIGWAVDSYANNADWQRCCACDGPAHIDSTTCDHFADSKPVYDDGTPEPRSLEEAMDWLENMGEVTFAKRQDVGPDEDVEVEARAYHEATDDECDRREL